MSVFVSRLLSSAAGFRNKYLSLSAWSEWCQDMLSIFSSGSYRDFAGQDDPNGESPAVEVLQFKDKNGYFASKCLLPSFFLPTFLSSSLGDCLQSIQQLPTVANFIFSFFPFFCSFLLFLFVFHSFQICDCLQDD